MKNILVIALTVVISLAFTFTANADNATASVGLIFSVDESFGFTVDKASYDFGKVETGKGGETTVSIFCRSNHGRPWSMGVQASEFANASGDKLPSDPGFIMAAWTGSALDEDGNPDPGHAEGTFKYQGAVPSSMMYDFYESTVAEGGDSFTALTLGLYITLPGALPSGVYSTNLVLTMHD